MIGLTADQKFFCRTHYLIFELSNIGGCVVIISWNDYLSTTSN